jgi:all-trans-retinol 13,14-reductase
LPSDIVDRFKLKNQLQQAKQSVAHISLYIGLKVPQELQLQKNKLLDLSCRWGS